MIYTCNGVNLATVGNVIQVYLKRRIAVVGLLGSVIFKENPISVQKSLKGVLTCKSEGDFLSALPFMFGRL